MIISVILQFYIWDAPSSLNVLSFVNVIAPHPMALFPAAASGIGLYFFLCLILECCSIAIKRQGTAFGCLLLYPTFTLNKYPTKAVSPIAAVPQKVIRMMAFPILEPPVLAANAPKMIRKNMAKP